MEQEIGVFFCVWGLNWRGRWVGGKDGFLGEENEGVEELRNGCGERMDFFFFLVFLDEAKWRGWGLFFYFCCWGWVENLIA